MEAGRRLRYEVGRKRQEELTAREGTWGHIPVIRGTLTTRNLVIIDQIISNDHNVAANKGSLAATFKGRR